MTNEPLFEPTLEEIHVEMAKLRLDRKKLYYGIFLLIITEISLFILWYYIFIFQVAIPYSPDYDIVDKIFLNLIPMLLALSPFIIPFIIHSKWEKIQKLNIDILASTEREKKLAADPTAAAITKGFFKELVGFNMQYLHAYNALIKDHTQKSFLVSIGSGVFGFSLIMFGLYIGFEDKSNLANDLAYLSAASGIIIEFISGIFFYLYNKTVRELKEYHNSLLDVQNVLLSFNIVQDLEGEMKAEMLSKMISSLSSRRESSTVGRAATVQEISDDPSEQK